MQKIFSTRLDEATLVEMERATRKLGMSTRQFVEQAIQLRVEQVSLAEQGDVWSETLGAWQRRESGATTLRRARRRFGWGWSGTAAGLARRASRVSLEPSSGSALSSVLK